MKTTTKEALSKSIEALEYYVKKYIEMLVVDDRTFVEEYKINKTYEDIILIIKHSKLRRGYKLEQLNYTIELMETYRSITCSNDAKEYFVMNDINTKSKIN